jgi:hypothetical protein
MTLTRLLGIKRELMRYGDDDGLMLAERLWSESGEPVEPRSLCDTLESILERCISNGIVFPAVLLKRKKQLERGTWIPSQALPVSEQPSVATAGNPGCEDCGGQGFIPLPGRLGATLCMKCQAWKRNGKSGGGTVQ